MSGISAIANFAQAKKDAKAAEATANRMMGTQETDNMASVQAQDLASLSRQQTAQQTASATQALKGMGPEAAIGGVANLYQAGREAEAQTAEKQAAIESEFDVMRRESAQGVQQRNLGLQRGVEGMRLEGAQQSEADRRAAGMAGIEGIFAGAGMAAQDIIAMSNPYGENKI